MGATTSLPNVRLALVSISTASLPPPASSPLPSLFSLLEPYCHTELPVTPRPAFPLLFSPLPLASPLAFPSGLTLYVILRSPHLSPHSALHSLLVTRSLLPLVSPPASLPRHFYSNRFYFSLHPFVSFACFTPSLRQIAFPLRFTLSPYVLDSLSCFHSRLSL